MNDQDRAEYLAVLARTRDEFLSSLSGITEEQSRQQPSAESWCILECTEHVVTAERGMYIGITQRCTPRTSSGAANREQEFLRLGADRSRKRAAPEFVRPTGRYASLAEAVEKFREQRGQVIEFVSNCCNDLHAVEMTHPIAGVITAQECLAILAMHPARHAAQIREIRQSLGIS
jgi:DinB superfamily